MYMVLQLGNMGPHNIGGFTETPTVHLPVDAAQTELPDWRLLSMPLTVVAITVGGN